MIYIILLLLLLLSTKAQKKWFSGIGWKRGFLTMNVENRPLITDEPDKFEG